MELPVLGAGQLVSIHVDHSVVKPLQMKSKVSFRGYKRILRHNSARNLDQRNSSSGSSPIGGLTAQMCAVTNRVLPTSSRSTSLCIRRALRRRHYRKWWRHRGRKGPAFRRQWTANPDRWQRWRHFLVTNVGIPSEYKKNRFELWKHETYVNRRYENNFCRILFSIEMGVAFRLLMAENRNRYNINRHRMVYV